MDPSWDSAQLQDKRWRRAVELLQDPSVPNAQHLKAARKLLRDGSDLACCMLFRVCQDRDPARAWNHLHPLDAVRGAVRFRALRILGRPSKLQGRDHHEAAQLLPWIAKPRDQVIFLRQLQTGLPDRIRPTLGALGRVAPALEALDPDLCDALAALVASGEHAAEVAAFLAAWPDPRACGLLQQGAAHAEHVTRWPYIAALLRCDPAQGRDLAAAHRDRLGPHHIHYADVVEALSSAPGTPPAPGR